MQFINYAIADRIENGFRVMLMAYDAEEDSRCVENIYELRSLSEIALFPELAGVHHVARSEYGAQLHDTGALSLAEALECCVDV